jgi:pimeloyl-ACP methyl ester carboxylesterase
MPVVLLHGLGGEVGFWTAEIESLARHFRVIAIEMRGSGQTPMSGPTTVDELADDVVAVLDAAGVSSCDIVGFSMGGLVAQSFALRWPTRLRRLVLASTFSVMNAQARRFLDAVLSVYEGGCTSKQMFDLIAPWLFSPRFVADPRNAPLSLRVPSCTQRATRTNNHVRIGAGSTARSKRSTVPPRTSTSPGIVAPTVVLVERAGHLINVEQPHAFRGALVDFLRAR